MPAIEESIAAGINVNVTLLFSVESYTNIAEAYIRGMERRLDAGESMDIHSVASFFVSRVDTEVDKRLEALGREDLRGIAAVANARAAYEKFNELFLGERFARVRDAGAPVQRPLWASTGVKDPRYPDTKYVETLVAPHTVNTMPLPTLRACAEKLEVTGPTADQDPAADLKALADAGIDMTDVTKKLLDDGIQKFVEPFDALMEGIELAREGRGHRAARPRSSRRSRTSSSRRSPSGSSRRAPRTWSSACGARTSRSGAARECRRSVTGSAGSRSRDKMLEHADELQEFVESVRADGFTDVALLGMGGSSLGPEVIRRSFGEIPGAMRLHVLDSTDPEAVLALERSLDLEHTLFVVSSKSGGTIETLSHMRYFLERSGGDGSRFVVVTDPGSPLVDTARELGFRRVFENDPNIGGRYSVLSYFGLVPAALAGVSVEALLGAAQVAEQNCASSSDTSENSGLWLGIVMGELALQGRDKLTFVVAPPIESFGLWAEQLVAESTGKQGKGVLPVADEPLGDPESYGDDRLFVYLRNADEPDEDLDKRVEALARADHPTITLDVHGASDLGRIFFFAEFATAVAGWVLGINPFDQPNVQEAKDNTAKVLEGGDLPEVDPGDLAELLKAAKPPHYVAILGFTAPSEEVDAAVAELRSVIRDAGKATTTFGYGPRYLHSTGQFHKGGPGVGLFLELVHPSAEDAEIPEAGYGFEHLKSAQAIGDLLTLRDHGLTAVQVRLEGDAAEGVRDLTRRAKEALS